VTAYVARRLLSGLLILFALTFATFLIFRTIPLDPACLVLDCGPKSTVTEAQLKAKDHELGVDRPVYVQYGKYVWRLLRHGNFGSSWSRGPIDAVVKAAFPATASVVVGGMVVLLLLALPLGILSAVKAESPIDRIVLAVSILGIALHPLVIAYLLRRLFHSDLSLLPSSGYCPISGSSVPIQGFEHGQTIQMSCSTPVLAWAYHLALPWLTFACFFLALYTRMIRTRVLETLQLPHVATARAKGASSLRVLRRHVLRIALLPLATMVALDIGGALMASIYIEASFQLNGLGSLMIDLLEGNHISYDLPIIAAITFAIGGLVVVLNLVADLVHAGADPRIRIAGRAG
jgi:peptide/nickel transport system permease protein